MNLDNQPNNTNSTPSTNPCNNPKDNCQNPGCTPQEEREKRKDTRRKAKIPTNVCFKCKRKPSFKYRNGLLCCG